MVSKSVPLKKWYEESTCQHLILEEQAALEKVLSDLYGYHLVCLGGLPLARFIESSVSEHTLLLRPDCTQFLEKGSTVCGTLESVPLRNESVDIVVLPHTLEHTESPHDVLREAYRILVPEGSLIIMGFNPLSIWGLWHYWKRQRGALSGKMLPLARLRDWLRLLDFQMALERYFYYRPPGLQEGTYQKCAFLETVGEKCWPLLGGVYLLLSIKRVRPLTPLRKYWRLERYWWRPQDATVPKATRVSLCRSQCP